MDSPLKVPKFYSISPENILELSNPEIQNPKNVPDTITNSDQQAKLIAESVKEEHQVAPWGLVFLEYCGKPGTPVC